MIKDFVIVDNFFDDPQLVLDKFSSVSYYTKEKTHLPGIKVKQDDESLPNGFWRGFRSNFIHEIDNDLFSTITNNVYKKLFNTNSFFWKAETFFHLSPKSIDNEESWWHDDPFFLAGLIYMNPSPAENTGTILKTNNQIVNLENKFNRLVFYRGNIMHKPNNLFGDTFNNVRKTITIFVDEINLK